MRRSLLTFVGVLRLTPLQIFTFTVIDKRIKYVAIARLFSDLDEQIIKTHNVHEDKQQYFDQLSSKNSHKPWL